MFALRPLTRSAVPAITKRHASKIAIPFQLPPFPVVESCPAPTCECRESPPGLDIEREQNINGSIAAYGEQVLISTGRSDWKSKIEEDEDAVLARQLKKYLTRGGKFVDPYHNVLVTNSSFQPTTTHAASAFLFPSFKYIPSLPTHDEAIDTFIKAFILPRKLHHQNERLTRDQRNILTRQPECQSQFPGARNIDEILILICGHGTRDDRCGKLGPILKAEFEDKLQRQNITILSEPPVANAVDASASVGEYKPTARVGMISHIGGHKWAGNVIVYVPPSYSKSSLAGTGIWYGRVGPEHVEGIVSKTIIEGKVIKELFRGGIGQGGDVLRL